MFEPLISDVSRLETCLKDIPSQPGCYLMLDNKERILYIGKSKNLANRVRSYFRNSNEHTPRISLMIRQIYEIEFIVTDTESEALTLESNLIKSNQPYFNILLKDDKKYPFVCITWSEKYPRIFITRRRNKKNKFDKYYGPFVDVNLLRNTLFAIKKVFPLRQRSRPLYKDRTCLNYSIERCPGVCQEKINSEDYNSIIKKVEMIFQGRSEELKSMLSDRMSKFSNDLEYEKALIIRDQIKAIDKLGETQKVTLPNSNISRDIVAMEIDNNICSIQLFKMRSGKLVGRLGYISKVNNENASLIQQRVIEEHYSNVDNVEIPSELITQYKLPQEKLLTEWLVSLKGKNIKIYSPLKGGKLDVVDLVRKNAKYELDKIKKGQEQNLQALEDLAEILELPVPPRRIEGYDISHISGSDTVASQVVFIDGISAKHQYRKYKIRSDNVSIGHSDDFSSIAEVIYRRFRRWSLFKNEGGDISQLKSQKRDFLDTISISDWPDLVMIDGGKGQLNAAFKVLKELNLHDEVNLCSLAKRKEEVFIPGLKTSIQIDIDDPGLIMLRRLRDEAHRFAISFHKQQRSKRMTRSELLNIEGIGSKRINDLLKYFHSVEAIRFANVEQLSKVEGVGKAMANNIWKYFNSQKG